MNPATDTALAPPPLAIHLFGAFEGARDGAPLPRTRSRSEVWLLAILVLRHEQAVDRSWLAGALWPEATEEASLANLRRSLLHLRRALGVEAARLTAPSPRTVRLDLSGAWVDVLEFDAAVARGDGDSLEQAMALYRGPLLEGCAEEWVFQEREARRQAYLSALESLAEQAMARGEPAAAARALRLAVSADPLWESAQRRLMQALAQGGDYAAAIQTFRDLRLLLHRELNAEPSPETSALFQMVRARAREQDGAIAGGSSNGSTQPPSPDALAPARGPASHGGRAHDTATLTFLFTDVEDSTGLWERHPVAMREIIARHDTQLRAAIEEHGGQVFKTMGDAFYAVFVTASDALVAALAAQLSIAECEFRNAEWESPDNPKSAIRNPHLKVRMAIHSGTVELRHGDYFGPTLNRLHRILEIAHGGQVLLSSAAEELAREALLEAAELRDLGSHRLRGLQQPQRLLQLVHPALADDFPPLRSAEMRPNNLPQPATLFIGREKELAEIQEQLGGARLLTLTGGGGAGKTRLALQVAEAALEQYSEGAWLVELGSLSDPDLVPAAVATALAVREEAGKRLVQTLAGALRPKQLLLLLDNCEHLLAACACLADTLLRACPSLRILATSREALGISAECAYRVPSLSLPPLVEGGRSGTRGAVGVEGADQPKSDPLNHLPSTLNQYESVRLFVDRAVASAASFALTPQNAASVIQVCRRLDGIPLAIELAAARVKALSVEQIAARLDDRFHLLTRGSRTALPHQQTLRAAMDWSYNLLDSEEQRFLRALSVFAGGWTLEAAEALWGDEGGTASSVLGQSPFVSTASWQVVDLLEQLVGKSLVVYEAQEGGSRYRLLETVREYARDRLVECGEEEAGRRRHRDYFVRLAEEAEPELKGPEQTNWLTRLEVEHDNLRSALDGACGARGDGKAAIRLAAALWQFWTGRGHLLEGRWRLEQALAAEGADHPTEARARALNALAAQVLYLGDPEGAIALLEESLAIRRALGNQRGVSVALMNLGIAHMQCGDLSTARRLQEESLLIGRESCATRDVMSALNNLGYIVLLEGDFEAARRYDEESLAIARQYGDMRSTALALDNLGDALSGLGDRCAARSCYAESLPVFRAIGDRRLIAQSLESLARLAAEEHDACRTVTLLGAAEAMRRAVDAPLSEYEARRQQRPLADSRAALGEERFAAAWAEGGGMTLDQVIAYAREAREEVESVT